MLVIGRSFGQLGNRLFLYAHLMAAAQEYGVSLANPCFAEYAHLFPSLQHDLWCRYPKVETASRPPSLLRRKVVAKSVYLASRLLGPVGATGVPYRVIRIRGDQRCDLAGESFAAAVRHSRLLVLQGWHFRSDDLLYRHAEPIRRHLRVQPIHQERVQRLIERIRRQAELVFGVHVRHGDYATYLNGRYFIPLSQYADAMRSIVAQFPGRAIGFLVCGNTPMSHEDFPGLPVHFGTGHLVEDMYSFAAADLLIGPPSTYTGWASFYGSVPLLTLQAGSPLSISADLFDSPPAAA